MPFFSDYLQYVQSIFLYGIKQHLFYGLGQADLNFKGNILKWFKFLKHILNKLLQMYQLRFNFAMNTLFTL